MLDQSIIDEIGNYISDSLTGKLSILNNLIVYRDQTDKIVYIFDLNTFKPAINSPIQIELNEELIDVLFS